MATASFRKARMGVLGYNMGSLIKKHRVTSAALSGNSIIQGYFVMGKFKDIIGKRFGKLTVISRSTIRDKKHNYKYLCRCDCGNEVLVRISSLTCGNTKSCGCFKNHDAVTTHGMTSTRTYRIWTGMKDRCLNPKSPIYKYYGARGIKICSEWNDFEAFYADMGECPEGWSIDRIDNDGDYCPENCQWSDRTTQANNTRRNINITFKGLSLTLSQWSSRLGIPYMTLYTRYKRGWSVKDMMTKKIQKSKKA